MARKRKQLKNHYIIYCLCEPEDREGSGGIYLKDEIRYIGLSSVGLKRPLQHFVARIRSQNPNFHVNRWINKLELMGKKPILKILSDNEADNKKDLAELEKGFIFYFKNVRGCRLTNMTQGGDGAVGLRAESIEKIRKANTGKRPSLETLEKLRTSHLGKIPHNKGISFTQAQKTKAREKSVLSRAVFDSDGNEFYSVKHAAEFYKISRSAIPKSIKEMRKIGKIKKSFGYKNVHCIDEIVSWLSKPFDKRGPRSAAHKNKISEFHSVPIVDNHGIVYRSISDASKTLSTHKSTIFGSIKNGRLVKKIGKIFYYAPK